MRFAAKEAIVKAMGTGFAHGMWIRDVGVVQNAWGKPEVVYSARGDAVRASSASAKGHVTLTDEAGLIVAVAVLMRAPAQHAASWPHVNYAGVRHRDRAGRGVRAAPVSASTA